MISGPVGHLLCISWMKVEAGRLAWACGDRDRSFSHLQRAMLLDVSCTEALIEIIECLLAKVQKKKKKEE